MTPTAPRQRDLDTNSSAPSRSLGRGIALGGVVALAAAARSLDFVRVFPDDGNVVFAVGDAYYHARRALYSFQYFPELLIFDPCINYPEGARVPHPPLLDWGSAALAQLLVGTREGFERWLAWVPVILASLAVLPIAALGTRLHRSNTGLLAASIYALMPICVNYGQLGNFDHHALVGLIGACLLLLYATLLDDSSTRRSLKFDTGALVAARLGMLLCWTGSLLYLIPGEAALLLWATASNRRRILKHLAVGSGVTAILLVACVSGLRSGAEKLFVSVELSHFHTLFFTGVCLLSCIQLGLRPIANPVRSIARLAAIAIPIFLGTLSIPGVGEALAEALSFLRTNDGYSQTVIEQLPVFFEKGALSLSVAHLRMGYFIYLVPLVPFAYWRCYREDPRRVSALLLVPWSLLFGYLAVQQVRYVYDYAPAGCVGFALILSEFSTFLGQRTGSRGVARWGAAAAAALCMTPAIIGHHLPILGLARSGWIGDLDPIDNALLTISGSQLRFAESVREWTDPTGECDRADTPPSYGVISHVGLGHVLHYAARRATPADPIGPYIGRENFAAVERFMHTTDETEAISIMNALGARYVATAEDGLRRLPASMLRRLHSGDGRQTREARGLERFRLIGEGPAGGVPMSEVLLDRVQAGAPYKLFELVAGATLRVAAAPGARVTASIPLKTPTGRRFAYSISGRADASGVAPLRVPYATPDDKRRAPMDLTMNPRVRGLGPYRVVVGTRAVLIRVSEELVLSGGEVSVTLDPAP